MVRLRSSQGQTSLEYLLLLAVVAVIVIASFGPGSLVSQIHDAAQGYYNTVTRVIMGNGNQTIDGKYITPINGGWCPVTCPPSGSFGPKIMYQACECPAPAFGGANCSGTGQVTCQGVIACSCPIAGQVCGAVTPTVDNPSGCDCPNHLDCSSIPGSLTDPTCTQCICPTGWYFDQSANPPACINYCPNACTAFVNGACAAVICSGENQTTCNPNCPPKLECACDQYSYWNPAANGGTGGCVYCSATASGECTAPKPVSGSCPTDATSCVPKPCGDNQYCNTQMNACQCVCNDPSDPSNCTYWKGNKCVQGNCKPETGKACPTASNGSALPNGCGQDSCGGFCGANSGNCPAGQRCNNSTGDVNGPPGTCVSVCTATEIWNGSQCVPLTPCGSNTCGYDSDGNACGANGGGCPTDPGAAEPEPCSSGSDSGKKISTTTLPGLCCLACQRWQDGACVTNTPCGIDWSDDCGFDSCRNACGPNRGGCPSGKTCSSNSATSPGRCS